MSDLVTDETPPGQPYHVDLGLTHHAVDLTTADFEVED